MSLVLKEQPTIENVSGSTQFPEIDQTEQFVLSLIDPTNIEEALDVYCRGYAAGHPFFSCLGATLEDLKFLFREKIIKAVMQRPMQNHAFYDRSKNNKMVGVYVVNDVFEVPEVAEISKKTALKKIEQNEICKKKHEIDSILYDCEAHKQYYEKFVKSGHNNFMFLTGSLSVLPEYLKTGFFQKFQALSFCIQQEMMPLADGQIDLYFSIITAKFGSDKCGTVMYNEYKDIVNEEYHGKKVFENQKYLQCKIGYTPIKNAFTDKFSNEPEYLEFYKQAQKVVEEWKKKGVVPNDQKVDAVEYYEKYIQQKQVQPKEEIQQQS